MSERHNISIRVDPAYLEEQSDPEEDRYVFSYTITMQNDGEIAARLLTRHWMITDAEGKVEEVRGPGVVGEHPYLRPGESFEYTSGAILETPVGSMAGSYQMRADDGILFDAPIPVFSLSALVTFH
ncbi:MAG: Co2+/Mg2+ efflux protein ApaG [Pseudomonadota bacterium]|nr:Co2+/Mg2+ efflux protein ApaG [Pseudomonadota bacterium]